MSTLIGTVTTIDGDSISVAVTHASWTGWVVTLSDPSSIRFWAALDSAAARRLSELLEEGRLLADAEQLESEAADARIAEIRAEGTILEIGALLEPASRNRAEFLAAREDFTSHARQC